MHSETHLAGFLGVCADAASFFIFRLRFDELGAEAEAEVATAFSLSEVESGAARFFPLRSFGGSLMINAVAVGGSVARLALYELY